MNILIKVALLFSPIMVFAQETIEVSEDYTSVIIFPEAVEEFILGNGIEYEVDQPEKKTGISLRTLKVKYTTIKNEKGKLNEKNTNLTVFTEGDKVYDLRLVYKKNPVKIVNKINSKDPIISTEEKVNGKNDIVTITEGPSSYYSDNIVSSDRSIDETKKTSTTGDQIYSDQQLDDIEARCKSSYLRKKRIYQAFDQDSNVKISLKEIGFNANELYFYFSLENKGRQSYDVQSMNFELENKITTERNTGQDLPLKQILTFNSPTKVEGRTKHHFVAVFEKFTIGEYRNFVLSIAEKEGSRNLLLKIQEKFINNPKPIKS